MVSAVFDTSVLVSAFLTRHQPRGVSNELLRFVAEGKIELYLSADIITEALATLVRNRRAQSNYRYTPQMAGKEGADQHARVEYDANHACGRRAGLAWSPLRTRRSRPPPARSV